MLLYIVRHGDPIYNPDSLTELGKLQADAVAKRLAVHGIDEIYSSPLFRAQFTANPTAVLTKKEVQIEEWMSENLAARDFFVDGIDSYPYSTKDDDRVIPLLVYEEYDGYGVYYSLLENGEKSF